ncbi:helix-turn-helix transcriptional regulator [Aliiroseovarius crassostreae]|uniref:helix-turn-helix transcriptional regulator n=1 Tax=Aliiroseovarius crassostreae TaxID=154981 RepID=UPI003C7A9A08
MGHDRSKPFPRKDGEKAGKKGGEKDVGQEAGTDIPSGADPAVAPDVEQEVEPVHDSAQRRDRVISLLYDVALDPARFDTLLNGWEAAMAPRRKRGEGFADLERDEALTAHFDRADAVLDKVESSATPDAPQLPDIYENTAAFMVDRQMRIVATSARARALKDLAQANSLAELGLEAGDLSALANAVGQLIDRFDTAPAVLRLRRADHGAETGQTRGQGVVLHLRPHLQDNGQRLAIVIASFVAWPDGFDALLGSTFGLTGAEVDITRQLVDAATPREIAEARGRSVDTVRAQIKAILAKTEAHTQVELVRLILSMMNMSQLSDSEKRPGPYAFSEGSGGLVPLPYHSIYGEDGRKLDYLTFGDPNGAPILYLHLDYGLARWPAPAERWAAQNGLRVIVPVRAGYGGTDPVPGSGDFAAVTVEDLRAVLQAERVTQAVALSVGSDVFYACHLERAYPGSLSHIIATGGALPTTRPEQYERMHKHYRFILACARNTPRFLPFMVKAGFHLARKLGKRAYLNAVFADSKGDVETFADPMAYEALAMGSEIALSEEHSAHDAFSRQVIMQETRDWSDVVRAMENGPPMVFFNGGTDPQVPLETLAEFQEDYPWIDFRVDEAAGQLIFFKNWPEILSEIALRVK